jgi:hypothetical protein
MLAAAMAMRLRKTHESFSRSSAAGRNIAAVKQEGPAEAGPYEPLTTNH